MAITVEAALGLAMIGILAVKAVGALEATGDSLFRPT